MKEKINSNKTILVLILLIVLLLASTYAWFTNNSNVSVSGLKATVDAGSSMQISATGATGSWKIGLTRTDLEGKTSNIFPSGNLITPFSTTGVNLAKETPIIFHPNITYDRENNKTLLTTDSSTNDGYYAFDLYFKSNETIEFNLTKIDILDSNYRVVTDEVVEALRFAFITDEGQTIFSKSARTYNAINTDISDVELVNGLVPECTETTSVTTTAINGNNVKWNIESSTIKNIKVYIWLEGQDVNCIDDYSIGGKDLNFDFEFKKVEPTNT